MSSPQDRDLDRNALASAPTVVSEVNSSRQKDTVDTLSDRPTEVRVAPPMAEKKRHVEWENERYTSPIRSVDVTVAPVEEWGEDFASRYELRRVLGAGGMGEVRLCRDRRIGREVALKVMRGHRKDTDATARFIREARVQGQLEHPSVVPVYDLAVDADGAVYFTMKRVRGMTLDEILRGLARSDPEIVGKYSRRKLLTAFGSVCLAMDFAHSRGVLHRDLKPANVMLGDFGEVHVLDWGLAKIVGDRERRGEETIDHAMASDARTVHGALMGTPGYMAPEQVRGEIDRLDARTDVYALGAMLFEILTLEPLHQGRTVQELLVSTLRPVEARPSVRCPWAEVPPELEEICVRATALDPADRFPTARALYEAIERYLDGDRDLQRRRELAEAHFQAAREALARISMAGDGDQQARAHAMREATRALALDPSHQGALGTLVQLLMEPPREIPPEAAAEMEAAAARSRETVARYNAGRYLTWLAFIPLLAWMGVKNWFVAGLTFVLVAASAALAWWMYRRRRVDAVHATVLLLLSSVVIGLASVVFGPFILVPGLAATNTIFFSLYASRRMRWMVSAIAALTVVVPFVLEWSGVVPPAYRFFEGGFVVQARAAELRAVPTLVCLLATSVALVLTPVAMAGRLGDALAQAERQLFLQAWQLRQLVPEEVRRTMSGSSAGESKS